MVPQLLQHDRWLVAGYGVVAVDIGLTFRMNPGVSMMVRLGQKAYLQGSRQGN
jgi:uncharacterized membrane protein HdeD (DUF308 family)